MVYLNILTDISSVIAVIIRRFRKPALSLQRPDGNTLYEIPLKEWKDENHRTCSHYTDGHPGGFLRDFDRQLVRHIDGYPAFKHVADHLQVLHDPLKKILNGKEVRIIDIQ
jgi:hypothetical protein